MRSGAYEEAARAFRAAAAAGLRSGALYFNLGVAYFRTGDVESARRAFMSATRYPSMAAPAYYNLGRIARDAGDRQTALRMFRRAAASARTVALRQNALAASAELGGPPSPRTRGSAELGIGYDSNPSLTPEGTGGAPDRAAAFMYSSITLRRPTGDGTELFAQAHAEQYIDRDRFDLDQLRAGWSRDFSAGRWDGSTRLATDYIRFDNATFEYGGAIELDAWRNIRPGIWSRLSGSIAVWRGGPDYAFLDGGSGDASAVVGGGSRSTHRWQLEIGTTVQDRRDADTGNDFFSYSSRAARLGGLYGTAVAPATRLVVSGRVQWHSFDGAEIRDGVVLGTRDDRTTEFRLRLRHDLSARWSLVGDATWEHRKSDVDEYDYRRTAIAGGVRLDF